MTQRVKLMMSLSNDINAILTGQLDSLPPLPSNTIKIFVCANHGEFDEERKLVWQEILPDLQNHCCRLGIDVIVVDMLLGNRDNSTCTNEDLDARIAEIDTCHEESLGPFFLCLLDDQYGDVPLPAILEESEFNCLCQAATSIGKDANLLQTWYRQDDNATAPVFTLRSDFEKQRLTDTSWHSTYRQLLDAIQCSAKECCVYDRLKNGWDKYFVSGLEIQIKHATWLSAERSLFVFRTCVDHKRRPDNNTNGTILNNSNFSKEDFHKDERTMRLKQEIQRNVNESNIIDLICDEKTKYTRNCGEYLDHFVGAVATKLREIVDASIKPPLLPDRVRKSFDYSEALVHLHHCVNMFMENKHVVFDEHVSKLQAQLINGTRGEHQLTIVKGLPGSGKTTIMTKMCFRARELFGKDAIVIPVFVGLTVGSYLMEDIFRTICSQINIVLKQELDIETYTVSKLTNYFHGLINRISKSSRNLLLVIDGIERAHLGNDVANDSADWLAAKLPPKVHIIVTCNSMEDSLIIKRVETKLLTSDDIMYISPMTKEQCLASLNQILATAKRRLTDKQFEAAMTAIVEERNPLVHSAITKLVQTWHSDFDPDCSGQCSGQRALPTSIESVIELALATLEDAVGLSVVSVICSYIVSSRYGLTELELIDTLSMNDDILLAVHGSSTPIVLRFPCHIWTTVKKHIAPILTKRFFGGKVLLAMPNRSCIKVIRQRYLVTAEDSLRVHRDLSDIFLEHWRTNNPFDSSAEFDVLKLETDRMLSPQPLVYSDTMYNLRKLQELWFHLIKSGDMEKFKEHTFCNFEYLLAMADADSVIKVVYNIELVQQLLVDTDIDLLKNVGDSPAHFAVMYNIELVQQLLVDADIHLLDLTLKAAGIALHTSPLQLANEVIGRMRQIKEFLPRYIEPLVTQCMEWCDSYTFPLLVPLTTWLDNVHVPFVTCMKVEHETTCAVLMPNGQHVLLASGNTIHMHHIATKRITKTFRGHSSHITCLYINPNGWKLLTGAKDKTLCMWDMNSETCLHTYRDFKTYVTCVTSFKDLQVICGTEDGTIVIKNQEDGHVVKTLVMHRKRVTAMRLCKANTILVSGSLDSKIVLWYTTEWTHMNIIDEQCLRPILCLDVSTDGTFLVAGCDNGSMHVIAMATGTVAQTTHKHKGIVTSLSLCGDCHHCVAATSGGNVYLYNFRTTEILSVFKGHNSEVVATMLSEDEQLAVTVSKNDVYVWSLLKRYTRDTYNDTHSGNVTCLAITSDSKKLITGGLDGLLKTWNLDISDFADNFIGHSGPITCLALANDNSFVVSGSSDATAKVWSLMMASILTNYRGHDQTVSGVHVLSDNRLVLSMDATQKIHMWRAEDGQTMRLYAGPTLVYQVSPNSQYCISGGGDNNDFCFGGEMTVKKLQIWKLSDGSVVKEVSHTDKITCLQCSQDSQYLLTGALDRSVKVWEIATGKIVQDSQYLLTDPLDRWVNVWDIATGKIVQIVVDNSSAVRCLAITDDNETIVSAGDNGVIHVCSLTLGTAERKLTGHVDTVTTLRLTADNSVLLSGSLDHTIRVWNHRRGFQLTMFDTHYPVADLVLTDTGERVAVRLAEHASVPVLCLHNSPARPPRVTMVLDRAVSSTSNCQQRAVSNVDTSFYDSQPDLSDFSSDSSHMLPIKPKPPLRRRVSVVFPLPPAQKRRPSSTSSIPQIIKHSPIKAPIQSTVKAQEKRRLKFPLQRNANKPKSKTAPVETKHSNICRIL